MLFADSPRKTVPARWPTKPCQRMPIVLRLSGGVIGLLSSSSIGFSTNSTVGAFEQSGRPSLPITMPPFGMALTSLSSCGPMPKIQSSCLPPSTTNPSELHVIPLWSFITAKLAFLTVKPSPISTALEYV